VEKDMFARAFKKMKPKQLVAFWPSASDKSGKAVNWFDLDAKTKKRTKVARSYPDLLPFGRDKKNATPTTREERLIASIGRLIKKSVGVDVRHDFCAMEKVKNLVIGLRWEIKI